jgi:multicomponent Na+:H+ antiporter subunit D
MHNSLLLFIVIPIFTAFALAFLGRSRDALADIFANAVSFALLLLSFSTFFAMSKHAPVVCFLGGWQAPLGINLVLDGLSALIMIVISIVSLAVTVYSVDYMRGAEHKSKYYMLLFIMIAGLYGIALSGDLFNLFIFIEMVAISSYMLIAFSCKAEQLEASLKYVVLGSIASLFILFAVVILYSITGTLNMAHTSVILRGLPPNPAINLCFALFFMGFSLKAALVPFHSWLPDAHLSAPAPVSAALSSIVVKAAGIYALLRITFNVFGFRPIFSEIMLFMGACSIIAGSLLALTQWDIKRLFAYSTVSQVGYIVMGIGLATPLGLLGGLLHLFNHAMIKALLFFTAGAVEEASGSRDLRSMGGLAKKLPVTHISSLVGGLSLAGIPPLNGFWSKLIIIIALILSKRYVYAVIAAVASIATLSYVLKVEGRAFLGKLPEALSSVREVPVLMSGVIVSLAVICVLSGIFFPFIIRNLINPAVEVLMQGIGYSVQILGG